MVIASALQPEFAIFVAQKVLGVEPDKLQALDPFEEPPPELVRQGLLKLVSPVSHISTVASPAL